jgi:hypothetical protein
MLGSGWSNATELTGLNLARSYLWDTAQQTADAVVNDYCRLVTKHSPPRQWHTAPMCVYGLAC